MDKKTSSTMAIVSMLLGIVGLLTTCLLFGILLSIVSLILGFIVLAKKMPGKGFAITGLITSIISMVLFVLLIVAINSSSDKVLSEKGTANEGDTIIETSIEKITMEEADIKAKDTTESIAIADDTTSAESPEEFKESCQEIDYKKLLRKPEDFIGQRIVITAKVQQVMNGGLFDDGKYYRVQTDNGNQEWYLDDEYFMYDYRIGDDMKILKEDVLKIYAEFSGLEEVKRALTKSDEEVPAIKAYYVELISE